MPLEGSVLKTEAHLLWITTSPFVTIMGICVPVPKAQSLTDTISITTGNHLSLTQKSRGLGAGGNEARGLLRCCLDEYVKATTETWREIFFVAYLFWRRIRLSPSRIVSLMRSKYSRRGIENFLVSPVRFLKRGASISPSFSIKPTTSSWRAVITPAS